jgi:hypothetical protein
VDAQFHEHRNDDAVSDGGPDAVADVHAVLDGNDDRDPLVDGNGDRLCDGTDDGDADEHRILQRSHDAVEFPHRFAERNCDKDGHGPSDAESHGRLDCGGDRDENVGGYGNRDVGPDAE